MSDIPDSISTESLRSLLSSNEQPVSDVIPEINFGDQFGGVCDLQYAISSLIAKSSHGVNMIQLMMSALHILCETESQFKRKLDDIDQMLKDIPPLERQSIHRTIERQHAHIRTSMMALEQVLETYAPIAYHARINELVKRNEIDPEKRVSLNDMRSFLLISTEFIDSLGLSRDSITNYLNTDGSVITP